MNINMFHFSFSATKNTSPQVLCGWGEVAGYPDLVSFVLQYTGNPVILMLEPDKITS